MFKLHNIVPYLGLPTLLIEICYATGDALKQKEIQRWALPETVTWEHNGNIIEE
jgi:hypothetical protein